MEVIRAFDALGWHRTGSDGDHATTAWLIARLREAGVPAEPWSFSFPKVEVERAQLALGETLFEGHPQFDAGETPPEGVVGPLAASGAPGGRIVVVEVAAGPAPSGGVPSRELDRFLGRCEAEGALGAVVLAPTAGSIALRNAPRIETPSRLPVLYLAPGLAGPVRAAAARGAPAALTIVAPRRAARADNVIGRLAAGTPGDSAPLMILTPKSGWFHCATERGCGIAIWLAVARALAREPDRKRPVIFLATSGHELGNLGAERFLRQQPEAAAAAHAWLHLGASVGAAFAPDLGVRASDERLLGLAGAALVRHEAPPCKLWPVGSAPAGEAENVAAHGGRYLSFAGAHAYFHSPEDRPDKVSAEAAARYAAAVIDIARTLVRGAD